MLQTPTAATMIRTNRLLLRRALDRAAGDARLLTEGVLYVTDLEARVAAGEMDAEVALADASRVARALTQTGTHRERRRTPRPPEAAPVQIRPEDCVVRVPGGPSYKPGETS